MSGRNTVIKIIGGKRTWYKDKIGQTVRVRESENPNFDNHWNFNDSLFINKNDALVVEENSENGASVK